MKALKIVGFVLGGIVLLLAVGIALALTPAVQTWAVKKAVAGQPGMTIDMSRVAVGLSATDISDLKFEKDGMVVTAKGISARYSAMDFLTKDLVNADSVSIDELLVDLRNAKPSPAASATSAPGSKPATPAAKEPFGGLLKEAKLPLDVRVASLNAKGRALLPNNQIVVFEIKGGGIQTGQQGKVEWVVDFADSTTGAALRGLRSTGTASVRIAADRRIDAVEVETVASAIGPNLPPDRVQLSAKLAAPAAGGNESYAATVALLRGNNVEPLVKTNAQFLTPSREIAGTWEVSVRSEQLAALLTGLGLPQVAAAGTGKFSLKPDTNTVAASGDLQAEASKLEQMAPALAAIGTARVKISFDAGLDAGETAQLQKLEVEATDGNGRRFAQITAVQRISYGLTSKKVSFAQAGAELARISIQALPLAWAQPVAQPMVIESGDLSLLFAVNAEPDGSRIRVSTVEPVALRNVTVRQDQTKLVDQLTLTLRPNVEYTATRITAELADLKLSTPAGDSVAGKISADITDHATKPIIAFTTDIQAKVDAILKPYLPVPTGPLTIVSSTQGRLEGDILQIAKASTTVNRANGALLSSIELQQPIQANLKTTTFAATNPAATAVQLRLGEVPLNWAEPFVANSKLAGVFAGGVFDISMRSVDDLTITTPAPVTLRGVTASLEGKAMVQNLDLFANFTATKRGETISYDLRRIEVKQGETSLASVNVAGEAKLGKALTASGKGNLEANVAQLMNQPVLVPFATLSRAQVSVAFDARMAEAMQAKATIIAKNLVAKQENRALGDLELTLDANMKPDGSGTLTMPLTLTQAQRKSDLNVNASFGKAANRETFLLTGKVVSSNFVVDDFQPLAGLAPASEPAKSPTPAPKPKRDEKPFWTGVNGKLELDLKRVLYGKDYVVSNIRGAATITDSRLSLDGLEGALNENPFKVAAGLTFTATQPKPYAVAASVNVNNLKVGELLRAANPNEKPALESLVTVLADVKGNGENVGDLAKNVYGRFDVTGTQGVLRALGRKGEAVGGISTVLGIAGALTGSATTSAVGELTATFAELKFDSFKMQVERGADLGLKLTNIEFLSPLMRTTGSGSLGNRPGVAMQDQPMQILLQFGAKGGLEHLLQRANALGQEADPQGYRLMQKSFTVGGTPSKPDSSSLWTFLLKEAAVRGAPALQDLLNRRR